MERFSFNLQKVLDFKLNVEEKKKEEFVAAQKHFLTCEEILNGLLKLKTAALSKTAELKTGYDFQSHSKYVEYLNTRIDAARENSNRAEKELNIKKEELLNCSMDRKVVEKLKENAQDEYNAELSKFEQKQNDDFALFSYIRKGRR